MSVGTDAQNLEVDATGPGNQGFVLRPGPANVFASSARCEDLIRIQSQRLNHFAGDDRAVAFRVLRRNPEVLVQGKAMYAGNIDPMVTDGPRQSCVRGEWGGARSQAQHGSGIRTDLLGDDGSGEGASLGLVADNDDFCHGFPNIWVRH
ncbi:hypothetical protein D3C73_1142170 [compost metagenome]